MTKRAINTAEDFEAFFRAYNEKDWDTVLSYLSQDCVWDASEERVEGLEAIKKYWTGHHSHIKETLGKPQKVVFGDGMAYLQVLITLELVEDGPFFGKQYAKGDKIQFWCTDAYTFAPDRSIKACTVYTKLRP